MQRDTAEQVLGALRAKTIGIVGPPTALLCVGLFVVGLFRGESLARQSLPLGAAAAACLCLYWRTSHPLRAGQTLSGGIGLASLIALVQRSGYELITPIIALATVLTISAFAWNQRGTILIGVTSLLVLLVTLPLKHDILSLEVGLIWIKASTAITVMTVLLCYVRSTLVTTISSAQAEHDHFTEQLAETRSLESLGRLAGGVAHDFNNLLTVILGTADLMQSSPNLADEEKENVAQILAAAEQAAELTTQLLAVGRQQVLRPEILSPNEALTKVLPLMRRLLPENIELHAYPGRDVGNIRVDAPRLEQVVLNLVVNARDALPDGGTITIETSNQTVDEVDASKHPEVRPGAYVQIAVSDTGMGMGKETLSRLFEPFFTTKEKGKGTGLGLATVHGIVRQSGGYIYVYSEPGSGTCFKIYLPRESQPIPPAAIPTPGAHKRVRPLRVLLVEDQEDVRHAVLRMLEASAHHADAYSNGEDALEALRRTPGLEYDVLLTDVVLPKMGGPELARRLLEEHPRTRILYMTGYTENALVHSQALDDAPHCLSKPFTQATLDAALAELREPEASGNA